MKYLKPFFTIVLVVVLSGCVKQPKLDYTAFKESRPLSILVLPPKNSSPEVQASYSVLSHTTYPLSESGYYVFPVALVTETFKQNGVTEPDDMHNLPIKKLHEIFGADAALYINVKDYGTRYMVIDSVTSVSADAKLVDLRTGVTIWNGAVYESDGGNRNNEGGLLGAVIQSAIKQIADDVLENGHKVSRHAANRLLSAGRYNGLLYGPHSSKYMQEKEDS